VYIPEADAAAVIREQVASREWYVFVSDSAEAALRVGAVIGVAELVGRLSDDDLAATVVEFAMPGTRRRRIAYMAVRKSAMPHAVFAAMVKSIVPGVAVADGQDVAMVTDGDSEAVVWFMASVESGAISTQRRGGVN
jgi:hypothetical protein